MKIGALLAPFGPARGIVVGTFGQALQRLHQEGLALELRIDNMVNADQTVADPSLEFMQWVESEADAILVLIPPAYEAILAVLRDFAAKTGRPVHSPRSGMCRGRRFHQTEDLRVIWDYQRNGGLDNITNLLRHVANITGFSNAPAPPPREMPFSGIHHPECSRPFFSLAEYLLWRPMQPGSTTVGLFFPRSYWIDGCLSVFDALIKELEDGGANVIAVFNDKFKEGGDEEAISRYFMSDGKAVVDAIVFQAYFFLKSNREKGRGIEQVSCDILQRLNVPAMSMITSMQTLEEYEHNPEGLTIPQYIITVALPEFDGISQPVLLGGSEGHIDPLTGAQILRPVPIKAQVSYLTGRLLKWCTLRKKTNRQKKIAIILHNSPCRSGVEATVGAGFGLDTLESTALLLQRMKKEGHDIDWVPESGKELIDRILERKAISEFRWTPLAEIIQKGGAAGFVPLDRYRSWLDELPEASRAKVFAGWGDPSPKVLTRWTKPPA